MSAHDLAQLPMELKEVSSRRFAPLRPALGLAENRPVEPTIRRIAFVEHSEPERRNHSLIWYPIGGCS